MCEVSDRIMERGRKFGEEQMLRKLVQKKLAKGMNIADIAEAWKRRKRGSGDCCGSNRRAEGIRKKWLTY